MGFEWLPDVWWAKWVWFALGAFVQEDVAILTSTGYATRQPEGDRWAVLTVLFFGVVASDLWKYFIGRWALTHPKARAARNLNRIQRMETAVKGNLPLTLLTVRFMPLARIPTYAACGYFGVRYWRYCLWIAVASASYIAVAYLAYKTFGMMVGEQLRWILPVLAGLVLAFMAWRAWRSWKRGETPVEPDDFV